MGLPLEKTSEELSEIAAPLESVSEAPFSIRLNFFSGPLDLLLHLVHRQEVSIEEVDMTAICKQYLEIVLENAKTLDLERATEYLVIAATLMAIKSQSLLPNHGLTDEYGYQFEDGSGFFEELRERLRIYELTKKRATLLRARPVLGIDTFTRRNAQLDIVPATHDYEYEEDPLLLGELFLKLIKRIGGVVQTLKVRVEPVSVVSYMMKILDSCKESITSGSKQFIELVGQVASFSRKKQASDVTARRSAVIGCFSALLELARRGLVLVSQEDERSAISVCLKLAPEGAGALEALETFREEFEHRIIPSTNSVEDETKVLHLNSFRDDTDGLGETPLKEVGNA